MNRSGTDPVMLIVMGQRRQRGPGFPVHDSHLFDDVDERRIANALQIGARLAKQHGFQYIVTLNSDALPDSGFSAGFDISKYIMPVRLVDATETGGYLGYGDMPQWGRVCFLLVTIR